MQPVAWWSAVPFALLLLCIVLLPLVAGHFWHSNRNKGLVSALLGIPAAVYLLVGLGNGASLLWHTTSDYISFMVLLGSLYAIAGGLAIEGLPPAGAGSNTLLLASGALLANLIGTTGASMVLIRPFLRINQGRPRQAHLVVFFIFLVGNLGGLLTPLGDPPLFLGFIKNIDFFWTLRLWPHWLLVNGLVLLVFFFWDRRAGQSKAATEPPDSGKLRVQGQINLLLLAGVIGGVLLKAFLPPPWENAFLAEAVMVLMAVLSLVVGPREPRRANGFTWGPIIEVAVLFAGIFVTMAPALEFLQQNRTSLGLGAPWQYFWLTGLASALLDNAPTYVSFATLAAGSSDDFSGLMSAQPEVLAAISCGAVFMGALTYLGNGPNFMIKAIAEETGVATPSFLGYLAYSGAVLLPTFILATLVFFLAH